MSRLPRARDPQPGRQHRSRDDTRGRILEAALELFARDGFDDTSVKAVAARSGVTDAAIFYYFPTKRHLLDALWNVPAETRIQGLKPAGPMTAQRLRELTDETLDFIAENHAVMRLMSCEALAGDETAAALHQESRSVWRRTIHAHFSEAFDAETADHATDALHSLINGVTMRAVMEAGDRMAEVCRDPAFRESLFQRARLVVPLSSAEPAC
jgi:AcrR family transcriptional regulator